MFSCCSRVLSGTQKGREEAERREEEGGGGGVADKPNYLLRIQRKCVINCGGPEEGFAVFFGSPWGWDESALLFTIFNWGSTPAIQLAAPPKFVLNRNQTG